MKTPQMTKRERLNAALRRQEVDRLPWSPLIDPYFINSLKDYDILGAMRYIGNDIMERHVYGPEQTISGVSYREEKHGNLLRMVWETPVGTVYEEHRLSGKTSYVSKHLVETLEDARVFGYMCEHTRFTPRCDRFAARDREIGDDGLATLSGSTSPIQEMLQIISGVENTVYLLADYPDEMEALFGAMHERNKRQYAALLEYPCDVIFDYEDTSTTVMNRSMFENYSLPAINDYAAQVQGAGKIFITHMCGKLSGFIDLVGSGNQNGFDSICPPETGDLYPWTAREAWGPSKVIIGGIDPPSLVLSTKAQILDYVSLLLQKLTDKKGFILSTGDAVPYGTPIETLKAITEILDELGPESLSPHPDEERIAAIIRQK